MDSQNSTVFSLIFLFVIGLHTINGYEPCAESIQSVCDCFYHPFFRVRCSHKNLHDYPELKTIQGTIRKLDASYNNFRKFPPNIDRYYALEILDLSYNRIDTIPNDITLPDNLRQLNLSYNNISNWINLNPNTFLETAVSLETLNLAGNPMGAFNGVDERLLLISRSLKTLDLSDCQINKITGSLMLSGLESLENLILRSNPLYTLPDLQAFNLKSLDVSVCKISMLRRSVFSKIPMLRSVNFSENHRLTLIQRNDDYVESVSLRQIDLSMCNMNAVELKGFPNLTVANLSGNLITELTDDTFQNNVLLESLDLSSNSVSRISLLAFEWLNRLRTLDLSLNMIRQIEPETFAGNVQLLSINLSRNFIDRFRRIVSNSITYLNMSRCEITQIDGDAIDDLPELIELDLSYNWFSELPAKLSSPFLQILDVSRCRLSSVDNNTFSSFPELSHLNLVGNRLTSTFRKDFFINNQFLSDIWLGDNPWRCECDLISQEFFIYLIERPAKLKDRSQLLCYSSHSSHGILWEVVCSEQWDGARRRIGATEKVWTMAMGIMIAIIVLYSLIYGVRWWLGFRRECRVEQQQRDNLETTRELVRINQAVLEREGQPNAPNPRESNPPCYDDAILMPRLKNSITSTKLTSLNDNEIKRATKRTRSEEMLSTTNDPHQRTILSALSRKNLFQKWLAVSADSSTALLNHDSNHEIAMSQKSFEIIAQLETNDGHSPYAKRKPISVNEVVIEQRCAESNDSSSESYKSQDAACGGIEMPIYQNVCNNHNESPHTSKQFFTHQIQSHLTLSSSSSSFSSSTSVDSNDYVILPQRIRTQSFRHSNV